MAVSPEEIYEKLVSLGHDWADKNAGAELLEETRKSIRAELIVQYIMESSLGKAEALAESDQKYRAHVKSMVEARKLANRARVNYDAAKTWCDFERTREATLRAQIEKFGG